MLKKLFAALVYSITHPNFTPAAVESTASKVVDVTEKAGAGLQIAHDVVSELPDGNTKDEALGALATASVAVAKAVGVAHAVQEAAPIAGAVIGSITNSGPAPVPAGG